MLGIILSILEVLGILLFIILGLLIVLTLCVLFVPFRYKITMKAHPISMSGYHANYLEAVVANDISIKGYVSWLLHIFHFSFGYHKKEKIMKLSKEDASAKLYVFGIAIINFLKEKETSKKKNKEKRKKNLEAKLEEKKGNEQKDSEIETSSCDDFMSEDENIQNNDTLGLKNKIEDEPIEDGFFDKLRFFIQKLKNLFEKAIHIKYTISEKYHKLQNNKEKAVLILDYIRSPEAKPAIDKIKKEIGHILKKICPKNFQLYLMIGSEKADFIGEILAIFGLLIPVTKEHVVICPDFSHICLEADMEIKGSITIYDILRVAWKYFFDKDIKALKKHLKGLK